MKPYNERLPLIDAAIDYYKGKLPREANPDSTLIIRAYRSYYFISEEYFSTYSGEGEFVCYEEEFEQRAKELGWVNGYKWGVEYKINGKKPKLPDYVVIEIESTEGVRNLGARLVKYNDWARTKSFRIVDLSYEPKGESVSENPESNNNSEDVIMNNDWYEKGELPPVGEICNYKTSLGKSAKVEITAHSRMGICFCEVGRDGESYVSKGQILNFEPLRTETDKLVEQMKRDLSGEWGVSLQRANAICSNLIKKGYRKINPMSEDEFVKCTLKSFDTKRFEVSQLKLICESLRKLYRAGCRFLDQGE